MSCFLGAYFMHAVTPITESTPPLPLPHNVILLTQEADILLVGVLGVVVIDHASGAAHLLKFQLTARVQGGCESAANAEEQAYGMHFAIHHWSCSRDYLSSECQPLHACKVFTSRLWHKHDCNMSKTASQHLPHLQHARYEQLVASVSLFFIPVPAKVTQSTGNK